MNEETIIEFAGRSMPRRQFLDQLTGPIDSLLQGRTHVNGALMFFREIVKNVYDHADGKGRARFTRLPEGLAFRIEDFGTASYRLDELMAAPSSKAGNGINYGIGLRQIQEVAKDLKVVDFKVDCSKGFVYTGIFPFDARA